ncbi:MAG: FAD-dependent oxidoreductase [Ruminococcus sp.]|uniref:FAD-dependent oxidoreductase n=1 Tax=Ruminococcus sp. TaxID=41978 RepID=UPI00287332CF|nr:FAD-dependent oxidoreductase [Ruminococcus sp.]MBQ3284091.1 FAD-dependent oxidoreductase [Ruminococcus sp.]
MDQHFDTVIIGAGPAGMGCGITLQKDHHNVCVIDKAVFPRNKTCAGLVTGKTYRLIKELFDGEEFDSLFCCTADTVKLYRKTELLASAPIKNSARLVNRIEFDNALVERYKALGGIILEGERNIVIDYENHCVILSNGDHIGFQNIIFADGALSLSHHLLKFDKMEMAFGIEAYVPSEQFNTDSVDLYFDCIDDGYLWVFPHGETVCIGVANMYNKEIDYKKILTDFLEDIGVDPNKQHYTGAFLPYGYVIPQEKLPKNVILVGDAGGFTDPISGEGLFMALKTGMLAAEALADTDPKAAYLNSVKPIASIVKEGKKVQKIFFSSAVQKVFLKKVIGKNGLVGFFYDNMVDEYNYDYKNIRKMYGDYKQK